MADVNSPWGYQIAIEDGNWGDVYKLGEGDANAGTLAFGTENNIPAPDGGLYFFAKSLAEGKHTISIVSSKGQADTVFYLKKATKSPDTGDRTQVMLWVILLGVSAAAVVGAVVYRKREK